MNAFINYLEKNYDSNLIKVFDKYFELYSDFNSKINISSIKDKDEVFIKHFFDSIYPAEYFFGNCIDVGCGGGFPGVPLCIVNKNLNFTEIDGVNKKLDFVRLTASELNLNNVKALHVRAEELKQTFDTVTARAVAPNEKLFKYCIPLVKKGGKFIAYKTQTGELDKSLLKKYNVDLLEVKDYVLPDTDIKRRLYVIQKC